MNYKTPGVYVEEISVFPPSVAQVETAIPAFIGYTEVTKDDDENTVSTFPYIKRIESMLEYETYFGGAEAQAMTVNIVDDAPDNVDSITVSKYRMYYALQMFYGNGGGPCYIISVGNYANIASIDQGDLVAGLTALKKKDEPTLILFPDGVGMNSNTLYYETLKQALAQCNDLGDRFTLCDMYDDDDVANFRDGIGTSYLKYGAAYHPWLQTTLNYSYEEKSITFDATDASNTNAAMDGQTWKDISKLFSLYQNDEMIDAAVVEVTALDTAVGTANANAIAAAGPTEDEDAVEEGLNAAQGALDAATLVVNAITSVGGDTTAADAALTDADAALAAAKLATDKPGATAASGDAVTASADALAALIIQQTATAGLLTAKETALSITAADVQVIYNDEFANNLKTLLGRQYITMPPTSAVVGIYALVDRSRGVWKAPANVSLNQVTKPTEKISDSDQSSLNVDTNGKSINAIRSFTGKGILIWGARTLAGNDNEWRYVSVRRFFNMVEESVKKATEPFVFEPNDANTWVKIRAMIENFLTLQWRAGALAGAKPEDAFFVRVGLGETMTALDILEGRLNVEIGMAAVRPAEFIILKFSHKMQES